MGNELSAADIMAMTQNSNGTQWDNPFIYLVWLAVLGRGGLFGNGSYGDAGIQGTVTRAELYDGFNHTQVDNGIRNIANGICDGFYAANTGMLNGFNDVKTGITTLGYQMKDCCCEINRNIDAVRYDNAKNTCDITNAIHTEGEITRALINSNTVQDLRDKLEARDRELMTANFMISQNTQTANLVSELRPCAKPAYITCSPYTTFQSNS